VSLRQSSRVPKRPGGGKVRGISVFDGDAFRKIEGIVSGDQGRGMACLQMVSNN
jgi:hypothetical protein